MKSAVGHMRGVLHSLQFASKLASQSRLSSIGLLSNHTSRYFFSYVCVRARAHTSRDNLSLSDISERPSDRVVMCDYRITHPANSRKRHIFFAYHDLMPLAVLITFR